MNRALLISLGMLALLHMSSAMYGLCSTNWFTEDRCFDFNDECADMGGQCVHPGVGDHGEGCICLRSGTRNGQHEVVIVTKNHFTGNRWNSKK